LYLMREESILIVLPGLVEDFCMRTLVFRLMLQ
jgi:hypothetical protein